QTRAPAIAAGIVDLRNRTVLTEAANEPELTVQGERAARLAVRRRRRRDAAPRIGCRVICESRLKRGRSADHVDLAVKFGARYVSTGSRHGRLSGVRVAYGVILVNSVR